MRPVTSTQTQTQTGVCTLCAFARVNWDNVGIQGAQMRMRIRGERIPCVSVCVARVTLRVYLLFSCRKCVSVTIGAQLSGL